MFPLSRGDNGRQFWLEVRRQDFDNPVTAASPFAFRNNFYDYAAPGDYELSRQAGAAQAAAIESSSRDWRSLSTDLRDWAVAGSVDTTLS